MSGQISIVLQVWLCLCHFAEYSAVRLKDVPGAADEWVADVETNFRDLTGPKHLIGW
jgi:hypothetical protein